MQFIWCIIFKIFYYVWEYEICNVDRYIQIVYEVLFLIQQLQNVLMGRRFEFMYDQEIQQHCNRYISNNSPTHSPFFGSFSLSKYIKKTKKTAFQKPALPASSGKEAPNLVDPLD